MTFVFSVDHPPTLFPYLRNCTTPPSHQILVQIHFTSSSSSFSSFLLYFLSGPNVQPQISNNKRFANEIPTSLIKNLHTPLNKDSRTPPRHHHLRPLPNSAAPSLPDIAFDSTMAFLTAAPGFDSNHRSSCRAASLHSTCTSPSTPARHRCNGFTKARVFHYSVPTNQQRSTRLPTVSSLSTAQQQLDLTTTLTSIVLSATFLLCPLLHVDSVDAVESPINEQQVLVFDHDQTLSDADFSNRTDLKGAIFSKANCKGANFQSADLTNAQLDDANMIGANLENVVAVNVTATKTKFQKANMKNAGKLL